MLEENMSTTVAQNLGDCTNRAVESSATIDLAKAIELYKSEVPALDIDFIQDPTKQQEKAFACCKAFLENFEKTKKVNTRCGSYRLKHIVEDRFNCYVYEGTSILAALVSGFTCRPQGPLGVFLNIRSIK